ncbi:hypothetical protein [Micromonospora sp. NBC_01813]|uniref:hypothetical protein n=1 Tax=Micromonospora sp. NBC_01813 TaxID=2975988 RepID=UPI002DDB3374|nr:hypothetical protein [Micromonospora sp. NBC_01813]WSA11534.1 hypothetical protein OG958_12550 [Micromonospora sp. NBC_01813]
MIELEKARELLAKAVETQGRSFVYNPDGAYWCQYTPQISYADSPVAKTGCLIGVALDLAGETRHHEGDNSQVGVVTLYNRYPDMMTYTAVLYFNAAQHKQDGGWSWGEAHDYAESDVERIEDDALRMADVY